MKRSLCLYSLITQGATGLLLSMAFMACDFPKIDTKSIKEEQEKRHVKYLPSRRNIAEYAEKYSESLMNRFDEPGESIVDSIRKAPGIALFYVDHESQKDHGSFVSQQFEIVKDEVWRRRLIPESVFKTDTISETYYRFKPEYEMDTLYGIWCLSVNAESIRKIAPNGLGSPGKR